MVGCVLPVGAFTISASPLWDRIIPKFQLLHFLIAYPDNIKEQKF
jgi:hypothetical protein